MVLYVVAYGIGNEVDGTLSWGRAVLHAGRAAFGFQNFFSSLIFFFFFSYTVAIQFCASKLLQHI